MKLTINNIEIETDDYVKKWTDWALSETPATDEQVIANVKTLYKKSGLKEPEVIVCRDYKKFLSFASASVGASVGASVWASVRASVSASVGASVGASVWASVRASVRASVWASVWDSVGASVGASIRDVWDFVSASVGAYYWADDLAFADVFINTKILPKEKAKEIEKYKKLLETQRIGILTERVAYVLVAPKIRRNQQGQLHSDEFHAVDWGGTGLYFLNGVNFEEKLWKKVVSGKMPFKEILELENIDQRVQAMRYGDVNEFLKWSSAKTLDTYEKETINGKKVNYKLVKIPKKDELFQETAYYMIYNCPSTERLYMSGVEKFKTVPDAMAWKSNCTPEQWKTMIPFIHES